MKSTYACGTIGIEKMKMYNTKCSVFVQQKHLKATIKSVFEKGSLNEFWKFPWERYL
jgi:hypothetical protein